MTVFDAAHATLDELIARTLLELTEHRAAGGDDDTYQAALVAQFQAAAANQKPTAGSIHMALALYRLAIQHQQINQLAADNARYAATMRDIEALEGL